jgi:GntR family transcriptional regulator
MADVQILVDMNAPEPVYDQIVRQIREQVISGRLKPGAPLPPVRQLAGDLMLNRNTVARAYKILEEQGVILTAGRKGTFVRQDAMREAAEVTTRHAQRTMSRVIERLIGEGLNRQEISNIFKAALRVTRGRG